MLKKDCEKKEGEREIEGDHDINVQSGASNPEMSNNNNVQVPFKKHLNVQTKMSKTEMSKKSVMFQGESCIRWKGAYPSDYPLVRPKTTTKTTTKA